MAAKLHILPVDNPGDNSGTTDEWTQLATEHLVSAAYALDKLIGRAAKRGELEYAKRLETKRRAVMAELRRRQMTLCDFLDVC